MENKVCEYKTCVIWEIAKPKDVHSSISMSYGVLADFLDPSETNLLNVKFWGKRKGEVCLLVPGCYQAKTNRMTVADVLSTEIKKIKERYSYFRLEIIQDAIRKTLLTKQAKK